VLRSHETTLTVQRSNCRAVQKLNSRSYFQLVWSKIWPDPVHNTQKLFLLQNTKKNKNKNKNKKTCQQEAISSANGFLFFPCQNFLNCHQTSKMPSRTFGGLQFFVGQQNPYFPWQLILRRLILFCEHDQHKVPLNDISNYTKNIAWLRIFNFFVKAELYFSWQWEHVQGPTV